MASTKTRFNSSERRRLVIHGMIKPAVSITLLSEEENSALRKLGRKTCAKLDAIHSRRRELGLA